MWYSGLQRIPELSKNIKFPETFSLTKNVWTIQNNVLSGELKNIQSPFKYGRILYKHSKFHVTDNRFWNGNYWNNRKLQVALFLIS